MIEEMRLERNDVAVEWYNADEGRDGYYDPTDPEDINYLRFDFYGKKDGEWLPVVDASYCTAVPADTDEDTLMKLLEILMEAGYDPIHEGIHTVTSLFPGEVRATHGRGLFEELSWIDPGWVKEKSTP